jgi:MFS family permease
VTPAAREELSYGEFRQHWRLLLASALGIVCGVTVLPFNTLGAVINPLHDAYGWSRGQVQFAYFLFAMAAGLMYPQVGVLADRFGARRVALVSMPLFVLAFGCIAFSGGSLLLFYAAWAVLGIVGAGTAPVTFTRAIATAFVERRGLALAVALSLSGVTTAALQLASTALAARFGWQSAFIGLACLPLLVALPALALYFQEPGPAAATSVAPAGHSSRASPGKAGQGFRDYRFWLLASAIFLVTFSVAGAMLNLKPLLDDRGISAASAAQVAAIAGFTAAISRLVTGHLIDLIWAPAVAAPLFALPIVSCLILAQPDLTLLSAAIAGLFVGVAVGAEADLMAFLTARYFGLISYGRLYGTLFAIFQIAAGVAPFVFGFFFDLTGDYRPILLCSAVCFAIAALLIPAMGRYPAHYDALEVNA